MSAYVLEVSLLGVENGAPSREACVVSGQMTQGEEKMSTPPPTRLRRSFCIGAEVCTVSSVGVSSFNHPTLR